MDQERKELFMQALQKKLNLLNQKPTASNESNENADPRLNAPKSFNESNNLKITRFSIPLLHRVNKEEDGTALNSKGIDAIGCENNKTLIGHCSLKEDVGTKTLTDSCNQTLFELFQKQSESNLTSRFILPKLRKQPEEKLEDNTKNSIVASAKLPYFGEDTVENIDYKLDNLSINRKSDDEGTRNWHQTNKNYSNLRSPDSCRNEESVSYRRKALNLHYADADFDEDSDTSCSSIPMDSYGVIDEKKIKRLRLKDVKIGVTNWDSYPQKIKPSGIGMMFASIPIATQDSGASPIPHSVRKGTNGQESAVLRFKFDKPSPDDIVLSKYRERGIPRR